MRASITDTTDSAPCAITVIGIIETVLATLQELDAQGTRYVAGSDLYCEGYGKRFPIAIRAAMREGLIAGRRAYVEGQRRRFIALPQNKGFLPRGTR